MSSGSPRKRSSNKSDETKAGKRGGRWPSMDEQLAHAGATPGSALDRLIRENQELEMLRPEEANDKLRLPAWLRIHWRKRHPDAEYSGASGGYPLHLTLLHQWMLEHQDLPGYDPSPRPARRSHSGQ